MTDQDPTFHDSFLAAEDQALLESVRDQLEASSDTLGDEDVRAAYHRFQNRVSPAIRIQKFPRPGRNVPALPIVRGRYSRWIGAAAVFAAAWFGWRTYHAEPTQTSVDQSATYATQRAQYAAFTLPDGSAVQLAPSSELRYTLMPDGMRMVRLDGEGYFTVTDAASAPFVVQTVTGSVQVLGTEFAVRNYNGDVTTRVMVDAGRVAVTPVSSSTGERLVLSQGMAAIVSDSAASPVDMSKLETRIEWKAGQLVFKDAPVHQFLETVGRWYGYEFRLADSALASRYVTTTLSLERPSESLQLLRDLLDVRMTFAGDTVVLSPDKTTTKRRFLDSPSSQVGR